MNQAGYIDLKEWERQGKKKFSHCYPNSGEKDTYFYHQGMFLKNARTYDLTRYKRMVFQVACREKNRYKITVKAVFYRQGKAEDTEHYTAVIQTGQTGSYTLEVPVSCLDCRESANYHLKFIREISIEGMQPFDMFEAGLKEAETISCQAEIQGKAGESFEKICYRLILKNCTKESEQVTLLWKKYGNEVTENIEMPELIALKPLEVKELLVRIPVAERIAPGGYEKQTICLLPEKGREEKIVLYTSKKMCHPFLLATQEELEAVKEKADSYAWVKDNLLQCQKEEEEWEVPEISGETSYLFLTSDGHHARKCAFLYRLGRGDAFGKKAAAFLKKLADPRRGYLKNPRACNQELVHEGEFFKSAAFAYDLMYDSEELTEEDHRNLEAVFRKFAGYISEIAQSGNVSNWALAEIEGALYGACVLQDMHLIYRFLYGTGGVTDILSRGVADDGWWYEASIGYNLLAAGIFSEIVHVMRHFGMDLRYLTVPASYSRIIDSGKNLQDGLVAENWGGSTKNYRNIPMMWDSLVHYYDDRGVIFGVNDSAESRIQGTTGTFMDSRYDLAYALYGKKEYRELLMLSEKKDRDVIFGKGELDGETDLKRAEKSAFADSAGVCVLRSKKEGVRPRDQIQAVLKYGSHGGAHGHYDRCSMTSLMRHGRSLTGPENIWYSYHTMLYKFYTQTSVNHNMVTVDLKMQAAVPPRKLLFYSGQMLQAAAVENLGVWSHPPYGGWQVNGDKTLKERSWNEGRFLPIPEPEPEYAVRTEFTEPILTRRLLVVTDDFVVNFDYAKGEQVHEYECLYHLRGLRSIQDLEGKKIEAMRRTEKLDDSPLGSAQFITDCCWYSSGSGACLEFQETFEGADCKRPLWLTQNRTGYNEPGILKTKLYAVCPQTVHLAVGCDPEYQGVNKQLYYRVESDGSELQKGQFGAWILGREQIDVDISGREELVLETKVKQVEFEENQYVPMEKTIFWGDPCIYTEQGERIFLSDLPFETENIDPGFGTGRDYQGGPVKIQAKLYEKAIPAEPENSQDWGRIRISLKGLKGVRFTAAVGGDYPVGEEKERRRTAAFCQKGKEAAFLTLLETSEKTFTIKKVQAEDSSSLTVWMEDGRTIYLQAEGLKNADAGIRVRIQEWKDGKLLREETAS